MLQQSQGWQRAKEESKDKAAESGQGKLKAGNEKQLSKHMKGNILQIQQTQQDREMSFLCLVEEGVGIK